VYQQQQQQQQEEQDAKNPFLDPPFSRIKMSATIFPTAGGKVLYRPLYLLYRPLQLVQRAVKFNITQYIGSLQKHVNDVHEIMCKVTWSILTFSGFLTSAFYISERGDSEILCASEMVESGAKIVEILDQIRMSDLIFFYNLHFRKV
jgi:hypothetical protein